MKRHFLILTIALLFTSNVISPASAFPIHTAIRKPSQPSIVSLVYSSPSHGKVNVTFHIELPKSKGGSKFTGSKIAAAGKTCKMVSSKKTCTITGVPLGGTYVATAATKNKKGFGAWSSPYSFAIPTLSIFNAIRSARDYLRTLSFSKLGLVGQLEYEGYATEDATVAIESLGVDWNAQALKEAKSYVRSQTFSRSGLINQLVYEKFSNEEAVFGVDGASIDWFDQAAKSAASYLQSQSFSRQELIDQLIYEGFSDEESQYGVSANGY